MSKAYTSDEIEVTFDLGRCIHAAVCVSTLPAVFDTQARPWIQPANGAADEIAQVIEHCPSGALQYRRKDGRQAEVAPANNTLVLQKDGPIYVHGDLALQGDRTTRVALCRCGASNNKPFCDNSHRKTAFSAPGTVEISCEDDADVGGSLAINPSENGPVLLNGNFEIIGAQDGSRYCGNRGALCRCGHSENKPFCDGTHKKIGFEAA